MKKSCVIYETWADQILNLPPDIAGEYIQAIMRYAFYNEDVKSENAFINAMLVPVKKKLDEDAKAWEETKRQRSEAGKKGMEKRWHNKTITNDNNVKQNITNITDTVTVTVTDTVKDKRKKYKKEKSTFHNFPERAINYEELKNV